MRPPNRAEMAFRGYGPCVACATRSLPGHMPLIAEIRGADGALLHQIQRN